MSLPPKLQNRFVYGLTIGGAAFAYIFVKIGGDLSSDDEFSAFFVSAAALAGLGGVMFWPRETRSAKRMILTGLLCVAFAFALSVPTAFIANGLMPNDYPPLRGLSDAFENWWLALSVFVFGPFFTFFIPYAIGAGVSVLFAERERPNV